MADTTATILWDLRELYKEVTGDDDSPERRDDFMDKCYEAVPRMLGEMDYMYGMLTTTNPNYTVNIVNGKTFSFRAECQFDIDALRQNLIFDRRVFTLDALPNPLMIDGKSVQVPDMVATLVIEMSLEQLRDFMRMQPDSHVMVQTLREGPISQNSFERNYML